MYKKNYLGLIIIFLILFSTFTNAFLSMNVKSKGAEEIAKSLNKFSELLPTSINLISNNLSRLFLIASDALSNPANFDYRFAISELFSSLDEANWKIDQSIKEIGYQKDDTIEQLKDLINILKDSLVDHHGQTLDLLEKRFDMGISNGLKKLEVLKDSSNKVLKEIGQSAHKFLLGFDYYIKILCFFIFIALSIFLYKSEENNLCRFMILSSVSGYGSLLWIYSNGNIYLLFIIAMFPSLCLYFKRSFSNRTIYHILTLLVSLLAAVIYNDKYLPRKVFDVAVGNRESFQSVVCPISTFQLIYSDINDEIQVTDLGNRVFKNLQAPLYIYREIGEFGTYKSSRMTLYKMLLLKNEILDSCQVDSFTNRNNGGCLYGSQTCTKGVWVMVIKISDIDLNKLSPEFRKIILEKDPNGTILLIDSEGTGDSATGTEKNFLNQIQIVVNSISSGTSLIIKDKIKDESINNLGLLAAFYKSISNYNIAYDKCNQVKLSKSVSYTTPLMNIIIADGRGLRSELGVGYDTSVGENINLDNTNIFKKFLSYNGTSNDLRHSIKEIKELWGGNIRSTVVLDASNYEMGILDNLMYENIPSNWESRKEISSLYSIKYHTLPRILSMISSKKIGGREANGQDILDIIDVTKTLFKGIPPNLFKSLNAESLSGFVCDSIHNITNSWVINAHSSISAKFPIETTGGRCLESSNPIQRCSEASFNKEFENELKSLNTAICVVSHSASSVHDKDECIKNVHLNIVEPTRKQFFKENQEACKFKWMTSEWSQCHGECPKSKNRQVYCALEKLPYGRRDGCCEDVPGKPSGIESCNQFTYHWDIGQWSECSGTCSKEYRSIYCRDCQGNIVNENHCSSQSEKPYFTRSCNPEYKWGFTEWRKGHCNTGWHRWRIVKRCEYHRDLTCSNCNQMVNVNLCFGNAVNPKPETKKHENH